MKVKSYLSMLGIVAMLASCSNEDVLQGTSDSGMKSVTVAVNLEGVNPYTRAVTPTMTETDAEVTRCYMEVLEDGISKELVKMTGDQTNGFTSTLSLNPEKEYKFLFWADGGEDCYTIVNAANERLQSIKVTDGTAVSIAYQAVKDWDKAETVSAELTHAVAKVSLKTTTDLKSGNTVALTIPSYSGYKVGGSTDDATDIFAGTTRTSHEYTATLSADITGDATNGAFVFSCYVLNNQNEEATLQYSDNPATPVYNVPLKANQHSTLLGDLANLGLTSTSVTATINPDWADAGTTEYPKKYSVNSETYTIVLYEAGALTEDAISSAMSIGYGTGALRISGPMNDDDIQTLSSYLKTISGNKISLELTNASFESLPDEAFKDVKSLTWIYLPSTLKAIGNSAFEGCARLAVIDGLENVETVGSKAFKDIMTENTINLISFSLNSATSIGAYAFQGIGGSGEIDLDLLSEDDIDVTDAFKTEGEGSISERIVLFLNETKKDEVTIVEDAYKIWKGYTFDGIGFTAP